MKTRTILVVLLSLAAAATAAPAAGALDTGFDNGDLCVNSACSPELLPVDCSVTVFFPSARCGFG